ncbi:MAG: hypothetical protein K0R31_2417 [Clostridiales bacterium]|jgi:hypothetical protein|nr:hypothetical protein [Clostridiales bacterium]
MTEYDNYERLPVVAQSCRDFRSDRRSGSMNYNVHEGVTCTVCKNWSGAKCVRKNYDSVITRLDG